MVQRVIKRAFDIRKRNKQLIFIILIFFLLSFLAIRLQSLYLGKSISFKGYHIHHFYFGTVALVLGGILGLISTGRKKLKIASALIGTGIGLFADEIGLLLNCTTDNRICSYYFPDISDIILTIVVIIVFIIAIVDWRDEGYVRNNKITGAGD